MKFLKISLIAIAIIFASTTTALAQSSTEKVEVEKTTKILTTKVKGITCSSDLKTISKNVEKLKGISACITTKKGPTTTFEIAYDPAVTTVEEIYLAIEGTSGCKNPEDRPYKIKL
jgi:copper chaperone CopZ